jgi:hypothetical protein
MKDRPLTQAAPEDIEQSLAHALIFDGRRQFKESSQVMAKITSQHLLQCLMQAGYVIMRKPPLPPHRSTDLGLREPGGGP